MTNAPDEKVEHDDASEALRADERQALRDEVEREVAPYGTILYTKKHPEGISLAEAIAEGVPELALPPEGDTLLYNLEFPQGILKSEYQRLKGEQGKE